jgi:hypothetical protein
VASHLLDCRIPVTTDAGETDLLLVIRRYGDGHLQGRSRQAGRQYGHAVSGGDGLLAGLPRDRRPVAAGTGYHRRGGERRTRVALAALRGGGMLPDSLTLQHKPRQGRVDLIVVGQDLERLRSATRVT